MVQPYGDKVRFQVEDFGNSPIAERLGVKHYPAIFIDEVLVATPRDFYDWGTEQRGRYTPWTEQASRDAFVADLKQMVALRVEGGDLEARSFDPADGANGIEQLPDLALTDLTGEEVRLNDLAGRVVVVEFWAEWCPPCKGTLDWLSAMAVERADSVEVIALALQSDEQAVRTMTDDIAGKDRTWTIAMADADTAQAFGGVMAVPTLMVFDRSGKLVSMHYGAPPDLERTVTETVERLTSADPSMRSAR